MLPVVLALALFSAPANSVGPDELVPPPSDEPEAWIEAVQDPRLDLSLWGGGAWTQGGGGPRAESYGAEASWRFDSIDLGLFGGTYRLPPGGRIGTSGTSASSYAPVYLVRFGQRFETRNGLLANFTFGVGGLKDATWRSWFQVALGARARFGPAFVAGELSFESDDFVRVALGLGVSLF